MFALDATSGEVAWQRNTTALPIGDVDELAVAHGTLYAAGEDGLVALNTTTQRLQWANTNVSDVLALDADDTAVAVGTWDPNNVTLLDAADGSRRWRVQDLDGLSIRGISVRNETVYVISGVGYSNSLLYEMNRSTGAVTTRDISGDFMGFAGGPSGELVLDLYPSPIVAYPPQGDQPLWQSYSLVRSEAIAVGGETLYAVGVDSWDRPIQLVAAPFPDAVSASISGPDRVAPGTSTTYSADTVGNVSAYSWNVSGAPAGDAATTNVSFTPGVHDVTVTVRNPSGWTDTDRRRVVASVRDGIDWSRTVRPGELATFTGQELADAGATLTWTFDDGTTIENTTAVRRYSRSGIRTVTGTVTHPDGWTATANLTVAVTQGDTAWTRDTEGIFDLTTTAETLYVGSDDGLQARVAETGDTRWTHGPNVSDPQLRAVLGVAADGDGTVITHIDTKTVDSPFGEEEQLWQVVTSLNASRNATWTREIAPLDPWLLGNVPVATTPSHAFVTDAEGRLLALNRTTGATAWSNASFGRIRAITTTNETVYVVASDPPDSPSPFDTTDETTQSVRVRVYALNATSLTDTANETVSVRWNRTVTAPVAAPLDQPRPRLAVTDDDRVVLALAQTVTGLTTDGTVAWTYPLDGRIDEVVRNGRLVEQRRSRAATGVATAADRIYVSFAQAPRSSEQPSIDSVALNSDPRKLTAERGVVALTSDGERAWVNISAARQDSLAIDRGGIAASDGRLYVGTETSLRVMRQLAAGQPAVSVDGPDTLAIGEQGRFTVQTDAETVLWPNTTYTWETATATSTGPSMTTSFETTGTKEVSVTVDPVYGDPITSNATVTVEQDSTGDDPTGGDDGDDGDDESDGGDGSDGDAPDDEVAVVDATLSTTTSTVGQRVAVNATISNPRASQATLNVTLDDGETRLNDTQVTVDPGTTMRTVFEPQFTEAGTYDLSVNGEPAGTLTVQSDDESSDDETGTDVPGFGIELAIGAILVVALLGRLRGEC
ncbi:PQQ-binding-like beta-propeller repeat protein [Halorubrum sp. CBA1125]|uniref:outer membrane protein assembly factor BamB family protein n=1 Tax=Halorubrum sp. CBA1125 TaxID=2668072 RepID=UPI002AA29EDA|nr:PQQ-binding-like beta-propeller repeat protein [Halorubrum sp. CBA1125]